MSNEIETGWFWWAGSSEEHYECGPCSTRDEAIQCAIGDCIGEFQKEESEGGEWRLGFHIIEARNDPLKLSDWLDEDYLNRAEDNIEGSGRVGAEGDEGPYFKVTTGLEVDLRARMRRACDEWQAANGIEFNCYTFSASRNSEYIEVTHPDNSPEHGSASV